MSKSPILRKFIKTPIQNQIMDKLDKSSNKLDKSSNKLDKLDIDPKDNFDDFLIKISNVNVVRQTQIFNFVANNNIRADTTVEDFVFNMYRCSFLKQIRWFFDLGLKLSSDMAVKMISFEHDPNSGRDAAKIKFLVKIGLEPCVIARFIGAGDLEKVKILVENGYDIDTTNQTCYPALAHALICKKMEIVDYLIPFCKTDYSFDSQSPTYLHWCLNSRYYNTAIKLIKNDKLRSSISHKNINGDDPLMICVRYGYTSCTLMLIGAGADINSTDNTGCTPLMTAIINGWTYLAENLIATGAKTNLQNDSGRTALMIASARKDLGLVEKLVKKCDDINLRCNCGETALFKACKNGSVDIASILIKHGADINIRDNENRSIGYFAKHINTEIYEFYMLATRGSVKGPIDNTNPPVKSANGKKFVDRDGIIYEPTAIAYANAVCELSDDDKFPSGYNITVPISLPIRCRIYDENKKMWSELVWRTYQVPIVIQHVSHESLRYHVLINGSDKIKIQFINSTFNRMSYEFSYSI